MKILLLSACGLTNQPEDIRYINLYLASLKRYVVPYFNVKVILFNNSLNENSNDSLTLQRVKEFGLENVVEVKNVFEMGLPENSLNFVKSMPWQSKIGIVMNLLFDYAKQNNFFDADWIFHTDTDIEFLENFKNNLEKINEMLTIHPRIVITLAGDHYPYAFTYNNTAFVLEEPTRINLYNDKHISQYFQTKRLKCHDTHHGTENDEQNKLVFRLQQQKVRNDFVGISKEAAKIVNFNWIVSGYSSHVEATNYEMDGFDPGAEYLQDLWKNLVGDNFKIILGQDKGSLPQFQLQGGLQKIVKIQLSSHGDMAKHFGSGYFNVNRSWIEESKKTLEENYQEFVEVWGKDYVTQNIETNQKSFLDIEQKIIEIEREINELKKLLQNK